MSAELLQDCLDRIAEGEAVEDVLRELAVDADTRALVHVALAAGEVMPLQAPSAMRARQQVALQEIMVAGAASPAAGATASAWAIWRRVAARAAGMALAGQPALGSAVAVSAESLPGDALYGVKRAAESARVALTWAPEARGRLRASMATERLAELQSLVDRGAMPSSEDIERLLAAAAAMRDGATGSEALTEEAARRSEQIAEALRDMATTVSDPAASARFDAAARSLVPESPEPGEREGKEGERAGPGSEDPGEDAQVGGEDAAGAGAADAPTAQEPAATAVGASPTAQAATRTMTATPRTLASATAPPASPTPAPASTQPAAGGSAAPPPEPTRAPPPTTVPATSVPPTQVPSTVAPPEPTSPPQANPRATERQATRTAGTQTP